MLCILCLFFFFKQKTAYEMRISDWSSDVCSSDLAFLTKATVSAFLVFFLAVLAALRWRDLPALIRNPYYLWTAALITLICGGYYMYALHSFGKLFPTPATLYPKRSEEHTSELQSLMRISYAVFCLKKKIKYNI